MFEPPVCVSPSRLYPVSMRRRILLASAGSVLSAAFTGCLGDDGERDNAETVFESDVGSDVVSRTKECETRYIRTELVSGDDEQIDDPLEPTVLDSESRDEGEFVELRTEFGATREADGEPDEQLEYRVTAQYLLTDETVYRTEGAEASGDPRDGTTVDCAGVDSDETGETRYGILVEPPTECPGDEDSCEFAELPDGAQDEFSRAIEGAEFESEGLARYELEDRPALLETECYPGYVEFEGNYYWTMIEVSSG